MPSSVDPTQGMKQGECVGSVGTTVQGKEGSVGGKDGPDREIKGTRW